MRLLINLEGESFNDPLRDVVDPSISYGNISLGNKIWKQAYLLSFCIDNKFTIFNPSFGNVAKYFQYFKHNTFQVCPRLINTSFGGELISNNHYIITRRIRILLKKIFNKKYRHYSAKGGKGINLDKLFLNNKKIFPQIISLEGWLIRGNVLLKKHSNIIRTIFKPDRHYTLKIDSLIKRLNNKYGMILGI
ncbi:uncharacterized protein METZ01_LOCUS437471, partial [marine metagenome]